MIVDKIINIKKIDLKSKRYDIQVENNHNFFANNILVHNCQNLNWSEFYDLYQDEPFFATEKLDGCLDGNTILETDSGNKTIKEICENQLKVKVASYDINSNKIVYDSISNYSIMENNNNWYELTTDDGDTIKLTGNHMVWLPELMCYRRVDELEENQIFLLKK